MLINRIADIQEPGGIRKLVFESGSITCVILRPKIMDYTIATGKGSKTSVKSSNTGFIRREKEDPVEKFQCD